MTEHEPINTIENREKPLAGKVALITGSSRDIGAEIAKALGQEGVNIIGNYKEKEKRAIGTQKEWASLGIKFEFIQADITIENDRKKLEDAVKKSFGGKLDYLILNAPVFSKDPTDDKSPNEHLTDELLPLMSKGGAILFMQSVPGHYEPQLIHAARPRPPGSLRHTSGLPRTYCCILQRGRLLACLEHHAGPGNTGGYAPQCPGQKGR